MSGRPHGSGAAPASLVVVVLSVLAGGLVLGACNGKFEFDEPAVPTDGGSRGGDDAASLPEACTSDATCGALRCDTATGECVACLANADCSGSLPRCDPSLHVCVACLDTTDCGPRQRCDSATHRCLDTCVDDDDPCPLANFVCIHELKLCVECRTSANCAGSPNGSVCDVAIGRCVECSANANCPAERAVCDRRTGRCVGCVSSTACGVGAACDPVALVCNAVP